MDSILDSIKKTLGLASDYTVFDEDVIMHINSAFNTLNQLAVGPEKGFKIENKDAKWVDFLGDNDRLNAVKSYIFIRVKLLFDPPQAGPHLTALKEQREELELRLRLEGEFGSTILTGGTARISGNRGDAHTFRITDPTGSSLINSSSTYEAEFLADDTRYSKPVSLDTSEVSDGVLKLPIIIENGTYKVRLVNPRRTLATIEVIAT